MSKLYPDNPDDNAIIDLLSALRQQHAAARLTFKSFGNFMIKSSHINPTAAGRHFHDNELWSVAWCNSRQRATRAAIADLR